MEEWKDGRMEEWKDGRMEEWKDGRMEEWKDGRVEGWKDGRVEEWKSGRVEERGFRVDMQVRTIRTDGWHRPLTAALLPSDVGTLLSLLCFRRGVPKYYPRAGRRGRDVVSFVTLYRLSIVT